MARRPLDFDEHYLLDTRWACADLNPERLTLGTVETMIAQARAKGATSLARFQVDRHTGHCRIMWSTK